MNTRAKTALAALLTMTITAGGAVAGATPASADLAQCSRGQVCLWGENGYTGAFKGMTGTAYDYATIPWTGAYSVYRIDNGANSVRNNGNSCSVALYDFANHAGPAILFNRVDQGYNYQDPKLGNGGGVGYNGRHASQNWQDRISSHRWVC